MPSVQVQASAIIGWGESAGEQPVGLGRVFVQREDGSRFVVPVPITATVVDGEWDVRLVIDWDPDLGELVINRVELSRRPGGPPIDPRAVRTPRLGEAKDKAVASLATEVDLQGFYRDFGLPPNEVTRAMGRPPRRGQQARQIEEEVRRAGELYEAAFEEGRTDLVMCVKRGLQASRTTAHRRIQAARAAGLIAEGH
jgi:hypothetical protein